MSRPMSAPTKVVGLSYTPGEGLPQIMLKGVGPVAEELLSRGAHAGTPVVHDRDLVERLFRLPMESEIGPELFRIVAVVLAHVLALNSNRKEASDA
jgi:flagellar biosynthesis protein